MFALSFIVLAAIAVRASGKSQPVCTWKSKTGANFDLRTLKLNDQSKSSYNLIDGDIPCTPETEPSYGYAWNFCEPIPSAVLPEPCKLMGKNGVVVQYAKYTETDYYCFILGHFDSKQHELNYNLIDANDPTKGVTVAYPAGDRCTGDANTVLRSATIEVQCANVPAIVVSAQEPATCQYHLVMKSYYGCPTECPVTGNGLCDSHGHCAFDKKSKKAYCYCNEGHSGSACSHKGSGQSSYDGHSVQIGLLVTLLLIALGLTGGVIYLAYEVQEFRKQQISSHYSSLPGGDRELVETVNFTIN